MAAILKKKEKVLFVSFAPGTGSTSLENYLRENVKLLNKYGIKCCFFPDAEGWETKNQSRHITYQDYKKRFNVNILNVATTVRNPLKYYQSEYVRMKTKWVKLLNDENSWIYSNASKSTLELTHLAQQCNSFNAWFQLILKKKLKIVNICL